MDPAAHETAGTAPPPRHPQPDPPLPTSPSSPNEWQPKLTEPARPSSESRKPRYTTRREVESLGVSLGPALHEACGDRLGDIEWFQSPWQHSGAATGFTSWRLPDGEVIDAIAKVPIGYREYYWTTSLGEVDPMWWHSESCRHLPVPRVLASGIELAGYDVAWVVIERVSGKPISKSLSAANLDRLFASAAQFHKIAAEVRPAASEPPKAPPDWAKLLERAAESCETNDIEYTDRWLRVIERTQRLLPTLVERWSAREMDTWCHGDLHPGNVIMRCDESCPGEQCGVLLDLGLVHPGHWVEDALYLERMYWGREDLLCGVDPAQTLARHRRALGMHADETDERLADVRRVLMGATSPAFLSHENDSRYLGAALTRMECLIPLFVG